MLSRSFILKRYSLKLEKREKYKIITWKNSQEINERFLWWSPLYNILRNDIIFKITLKKLDSCKPNLISIKVYIALNRLLFTLLWNEAFYGWKLSKHIFDTCFSKELLTVGDVKLFCLTSNTVKFSWYWDTSENKTMKKINTIKKVA